MTIEHFRLLAGFNRWANGQVYYQLARDQTHNGLARSRGGVIHGGKRR